MPFCAWCGNTVSQVSYSPCPRCGNPTNGAQRAARAGGSDNTGIIIGIVIGGIVLVAFIGILAAIAIPNLLTALQRSRGKRTMADMRSIATALESYATDHNDEYPPATSPYVASLSSELSPAYIKSVPTVDGWGTALRYECWPAGKCEHYAIGSAAGNQKFEQDSLQNYSEGATTQFDADIVFSDGKFVQYPEKTTGGSAQ